MIRLFETACDDDEVGLVEEVLRDGTFIMGPNVEALEAELETYFGRGAVVTCNSGTDALRLAIESVIEPTLTVGEIIVPAMTFSATYEAVLLAGLQPVVCDVDRETLTLTVDDLSKLKNQRTKAVVVVHLYGWPAPDIYSIKQFCQENDLFLIEDCAQCFGASMAGILTGKIGDAAAFSFYPTKPLGGIGDGGAVLVNMEVQHRIAARRNHGRNGIQERAGFNSRLDEVNAAVIRHRLRKHAATVAHLRELAALYDTYLGSKTICQSTAGRPAPYVYPFILEDKEQRRKAMWWLNFNDIETRIHYDPPVSQLPYTYTGYSCPNAKDVAIMSLPCHRGMSAADVDRICDVLGRKDKIAPPGRA